ncbi:MAG: winged helix-turn-helix domain-containing protein, partial [Gammaproteobacteria bacterium]|nr:winged helix-turn-helix domain-containing protein [Gammaproteobacteria bacterium]
LGSYPRERLNDLVYGKKTWTEQWAHEASIIPMDVWPLLRHRMARHTPRPRGFQQFLRKNKNYVADVVDQIRSTGPVAPQDLPRLTGVDTRLTGSWIGTVQRAVLEFLFGQGQIAAVGRRKNFSREYDLADRVIPAQHFNKQLTEHAAQRELLQRAAAACGVATVADLADYFRMSISAARPRVAELVEEGVLQSVDVEQMGQALVHCDARLPRSVTTAALLSPFDPLVWFRPRLKRLFDFDYRLEIFMPSEQRKWGYYVMPFLLGDTLVARLDIKADRENSRLQVIAAYKEPGTRAGDITAPLIKELRQLAGWLGLASVQVGGKGNLARGLSRAARGK